MKTRFYYSLADLSGWENSFKIDSDKNWKSLILAATGVTISRTVDSKANGMLVNYLWPRFYDEAILYIDVEHNPWTEPIEPSKEEQQEAAKSIFGRIYSWIISSSDKYVQIIKLYEEHSNELMKTLGSKSTTLFNDTPQNAEDVTASSYVTTATTATTSADTATPMARLEEIRQGLDSLNKEWADGFRQFIIF